MPASLFYHVSLVSSLLLATVPVLLATCSLLLITLFRYTVPGGPQWGGPNTTEETALTTTAAVKSLFQLVADGMREVPLDDVRFSSEEPDANCVMVGRAQDDTLRLSALSLKLDNELKEMKKTYDGSPQAQIANALKLNENITVVDLVRCSLNHQFPEHSNKPLKVFSDGSVGYRKSKEENEESRIFVPPTRHRRR